MPWNQIVRRFATLGVITLTVLSFAYAQEREKVIDIRDNPEPTVDEIADALFPPSPMATRSLGKREKDYDKLTVVVDIRFARGSAEIPVQSPQEIEKLRKFGEAIRQHPNAPVTIVGHTDSDGDERTNQTLSERRAQSIKNHLIRNFSVDPQRLEARGYGESKPICPANDTP